MKIELRTSPVSTVGWPKTHGGECELADGPTMRLPLKPVEMPGEIFSIAGDQIVQHDQSTEITRQHPEIQVRLRTSSAYHLTFPNMDLLIFWTCESSL